jgi:hypothetical protein
MDSGQTNGGGNDMHNSRLFAVCVALAGAAIGWASPASAESLGGTYTATIGTGSTLTYTWVFTPCGPDCARLNTGNPKEAIQELHLQGTTWSGSGDVDGATCRTTLDSNSLAGSTTLGCGGLTFPVQLSKVG